MNTIERFIKKLLPAAKKVEEDEGFDYLFLLAQVALETGWLKHATIDDETGEDSKNLFNIKGSYNGEYVIILTTEYDKNNKPYKIRDKFRKYPSYEDSIKDWVRLLKTPRYEKAYKNRHNVYYLAKAIHECGYATDPKYVEKIVKIAKIIKRKEYILTHNKETLKIGDKGESVKEIQEKLLQLDYSIMPDGIFGSNTKKAVMKFQKDNKLSSDGIVGYSTHYMLDIRLDLF